MRTNEDLITDHMSVTEKTYLSKITNLKALFDMQIEFQAKLGNAVPTDDPEMFAHHLLGLVSEIGEVSQADKRWKKNRRNTEYDKENKLEEIADCMVFLFNICMYSGFDAVQLWEATYKKILKNFERLDEK